MLIWYRNRHINRGLSGWYQCDEDDFKQMLNNKTFFHMNNWVESLENGKHFKYYKNYDKEVFWKAKA